MEKLDIGETSLDIFKGDCYYFFESQNPVRFNLNIIGGKTYKIPKGKSKFKKSKIENQAAVVELSTHSKIILNQETTEKSPMITFPDDIRLIEVEDLVPTYTRKDNVVHGEAEIKGPNVVFNNLVIGQEYEILIKAYSSVFDKEKKITISGIEYDSDDLDLTKLNREVSIKTEDGLSGTLRASIGERSVKSEIYKRTIPDNNNLDNITLPLPHKFDIGADLNYIIRFFNSEGSEEIRKEVDSSDDIIDICLDRDVEMLIRKPSWLIGNNFKLTANNFSVFSDFSLGTNEITRHPDSYKLSYNGVKGFKSDFYRIKRFSTDESMDKKEINLRNYVKKFHIDIFFSTSKDLTLTVFQDDEFTVYLTSENRTTIVVEDKKVEISVKEHGKTSELDNIIIDKEEVPYTKSLFLGVI